MVDALFPKTVLIAKALSSGVQKIDAAKFASYIDPYSVTVKIFEERFRNWREMHRNATIARHKRTALCRGWYLTHIFYLESQKTLLNLRHCWSQECSCQAC